MAVTNTLRDAAYITVGAAVLGFQKAQVRRHELTEQLKGQQARFGAGASPGDTRSASTPDRATAR